MFLIVIKNGRVSRISIERIRYEKNPHVSGYYDGGLGKHHGTRMSLVVSSRTSGVAVASAPPGSVKREEGVLLPNWTRALGAVALREMYSSAKIQ